MQNANAWIITGISSGFGNELARRLLAAGKTVVGTVRSTTKIEDLIAQYPDTLDVRVLDVTDVPAVHAVLTGAIKDHGGVDVLISNAGFGLFGAAEELTDEDIDKIIATDLTGSIQVIRTVLPFMRRARHGRIIQISSYDGQVAYAANSLYHAAKFGIEGFCESVAQGPPSSCGCHHRRAGRRLHRVPLRQRPRRQPHARVRSRAWFPRHVRPLQGSRRRRPREDGGPHDRVRRH